MADEPAPDRIDRSLVARALLGNDRSAFEHLVRRHQGSVRAQLRRLVGSDHARADDLAQETFVLAWRKLDRFRGEARFSTWLYRIAYNCFLQDRRKSSGAPPTGDMPEPPQHGEADHARRFDIERAMLSLSQAERTVLLHLVQLGMSHEEAAFVLAMPVGTIKSHARRGKARLRVLLAEWEDYAWDGGEDGRHG